MKPRIIYKPAFTLIGIWSNENPSPKSVDAQWERLGERYAEIPGVDPDQGYGVHVKNGDEEKYLAGLMVREGITEGKVPDGMSVLSIEAQAYAVFHHFGRMDRFDTTIENIFAKWLPASGLKTTENFYFEYYDDQFSPDADDSLLFIYIPTKELAT